MTAPRGFKVDEVLALIAERDRLREALKRIGTAHAPAEHLQRIAREALGPRSEGERG